MGRLVSKTIPGFYNGVSQQSVTMRLDTQGELQENAMGTIVDGLYTRPHTEHIALFTSGYSANAFMHTINRDTTERYVVFITADPTSPIEVYKLDGTPCTVRYGHLDGNLAFTADASVKSYLTTTDALPKAYKALSIADYTLIVNRSKITAMTSAVKAGTIIDRVQTFLELPLPWDDTLYYNAAKTYTKGDLVKYTDRKIYYYTYDTDVAGVLPTNTDYWRVEDTFCSEGELYEITGDEVNNWDNYYVEFVGGVWQETLGPGEKYQLDATTMPHRLVRTAEGQFTFAPCLWEDRVVGDEDSCPLPSFLGKPITNLVFFKNRLGFLAQDTFFLSRAGRYFELFGETAVDLLDDDPIDTLASSNSVVSLVSSIPFDKNLLVNSEQGQFSVGSSGSNLTPSTASITATTMYDTDPDSDPVGAGATVYFCNPRNKYVSIMEYLIQPDTLTEDAADVTAHCPHFIPNGTIKICSCIPMDMLILFSTGDPSSLYIYKYYWVGNEKPQSAWSKWKLDGEIMGIGLINTTLFITIKRGNEVALESVQLENTPINPDFTFRVCLDRQVRLQGTYNAATGKTSWTLPYTPTSLEKLRCINPINWFSMTNITLNGNVVSISGDHSNGLYVFGEAYTMRYRLSEWYVKDSNKIAAIDGRLQVRTLTISYKNTGEFRVEVTPLGRETTVKYFSGVRIGVSKIGKASLLTGEERFPILAKSKYTTIDIVSDSHLPCQIISGSFEGMYVIRAEKI